MVQTPPDLGPSLRILLIAFRFPPMVGGGVHRPVRLVKHWSQNDQQVAVLTATTDRREPQDQSLLATIPPETPIEQVSDHGLPELLQRLRNRMQNSGVGRRLARLLGYVQALFQSLSLPDRHAAWTLPAVLRGVRLARRFNPDVIVATGPPFTPFLVATLLASIVKKPLVIDYRDAWMGSFVSGQRTFLQRLANPAIERWVLGRAAGVVAAHRSVLRDLPPAKRNRRSARRLWVPNGYDPDDFHADAEPVGDRFLITYSGSLFGRRDPRTFFQVLDRLLRDGRVDPARIRVRVAGVPGGRLRAFLGRLDAVSQVLEDHGYISHRESIALLEESTVNLVVVRDVEPRNRHYPGKVYEVLFVARPVLLLAPEGVTAQLVRRAGGGRVVHPRDAAGIETALLELYSAWRDGTEMARPDRHGLRFYDRALQARRFLALLSKVCESDVGARRAR